MYVKKKLLIKNVYKEKEENCVLFVTVSLVIGK
jgi:hypothetical protein